MRAAMRQAFLREACECRRHELDCVEGYKPAKLARPQKIRNRLATRFAMITKAHLRTSVRQRGHLVYM